MNLHEIESDTLLNELSNRIRTLETQKCLFQLKSKLSEPFSDTSVAELAELRSRLRSLEDAYQSLITEHEELLDKYFTLKSSYNQLNQVARTKRF